MDSDDPIAEILMAAGVMDAAEEHLTGFGRRFPRTMRFVRLVGGAFLVLFGLFEALASLWAFADLTYNGEFPASLLLLVLLAMGVFAIVWGLATMRRGWASRRRRRKRSRGRG